MTFEDEGGEAEIEAVSPDNANDDASENDNGSDDIGQHEEAAAKARGWVAKDEFRGRPEDWQDAKSFLDRNSSLQSSVKELESRLAAKDEEYAERIRRIEAANDRIMQENHEKLIRELREAKRSAVELGDIEQFDRLEQEEDSYYQRIAQERQREASQPAKAQQPKLLPETEQWIQRNSWFTENQNMQQIALGFYNEAMEGMPRTQDENKRLAYVEKRMAEVYPDKFGGGRATAVEGGGRGMGSPNPISKLTAEERAACKKFIARGIIKDEKEYIKYLNEY